MESPRRAFIRITAARTAGVGRARRESTAGICDSFPSLSSSQRGDGEVKAPDVAQKSRDAASSPETTPEELILSGYRQVQSALASDLLERVKAASPAFFERLVVQLLVAMGYGGSMEDAGKAIGRPGDEGIDGIIKEDRLGLDVIYLQAKRWERTIGRPDIQQFAGALQGQRARKGVFITTSSFSADARAIRRAHRHADHPDRRHRAGEVDDRARRRRHAGGRLRVEAGGFGFLRGGLSAR